MTERVGSACPKWTKGNWWIQGGPLVSGVPSVQTTNDTETATCPPGTYVSGGGYSFEEDGDGLLPYLPEVYQDGPSDNNERWTVSDSNGSSKLVLNVYVECAQ